mgnify:CR=1 FL=1
MKGASSVDEERLARDELAVVRLKERDRADVLEDRRLCRDRGAARLSPRGTRQPLALRVAGFGVRRANDVARAVALGADAVLIGRMSVYGLALGGEAGVTRMYSGDSPRIKPMFWIESAVLT